MRRASLACGFTRRFSATNGNNAILPSLYLLEGGLLMRADRPLFSEAVDGFGNDRIPMGGFRHQPGIPLMMISDLLVRKSFSF
jgi:hypothetical protein